ncbi:MAG: hypothetical protein AAF849_12200 [Bacteroidota bacterium]
MKKNIILFCALLFSVQLALAQQNTALQQELDQYTQTYQLNERQQIQVKKMLETKYTNLAELQSIQASDAELYEKKSMNLERQTRMGVKSILSETQLVIYQRVREQKRLDLRQKIKQMQNAGAEKKEIAKAVEELKNF